MTRYLVNISRWIDSTLAQVGDTWTQTVVLLQASSQVDAAGASQLRLICNFLLSPSQCGCKVCLVLPHGHTTTVCAVGSVKVLLLCSLHRWCARRQRFRSAGVCHGPSGVVFSVLRRMLKETAHAFRGCASFCFFFFFCTFVLCVSAIAGHSCPAMSSVQRQSHVCFCLFALLVIHGEFPNIVLLRALCAALTYILHAVSDCVVSVSISSVFFVYGDLVAFACR